MNLLILIVMIVFKNKKLILFNFVYFLLVFNINELTKYYTKYNASKIES